MISFSIFQICIIPAPPLSNKHSYCCWGFTRMCLVLAQTGSLVNDKIFITAQNNQCLMVSPNNVLRWVDASQRVNKCYWIINADSACY